MEHHEHHHDHDAAEADRDLPDRHRRPPEAAPTQVVELADGDTFELRIAPVAKRIGDDTVRMIAYNGSIPGPTLRVPRGLGARRRRRQRGRPRGDRALARAAAREPLRRHARDAGADPGRRRFSYRISFPDPGVYWYHPHIREDYGQELGQYGNILVDPAEPDYWPPAHRELLLTLDDVFIEDGQIAPFSRDETTFAAMGRYGNVMLVAGETAPSFSAQQGEVVRLYLTNTANTRVFNVALPGARMKLVGGDSGRVEREEFVESVVLAPSERVVVDVLFEAAGTDGARAPNARAHLHARDDRRRRGAGHAVARGRVRRSAREPGVVGTSGDGSRPTPTRRRTRRSRSSRRWTWACPRATSSTSARCIPRSSARSPTAVPSAA